MPVRNAPTWTVYLNAEPTTLLQPLKVQRSLNGEHLDHAELMLDTTKLATFNGLDDFSAFQWLGKHVWIQVASGIHAGKFVHQGVISMVIPRFNEREAGLRIISRTEAHQFGLTLFGQLHWNPVNDQYFITDDDLLFNPTIDGITCGNKHGSKTYNNVQFMNQSIQVTNEIPIFLDPEATRTAAARQLQEGNSVSWTLSEVLYYICWMANRTEGFLINPTLAELQAVVIDSVDLVRNLKIRAGSTLPAALDAVLVPLGYHWRLKFEGLLAKIAIIRRATGGELRWLKHQRLGSTLSTAETNTEAMGVAFDLSPTRNQIVAKGGRLQVEITAELHRGWPASLDSRPLDQLKYSVVKDSENPDLKNAWRKWVLNEAGDYNGSRGITGIFTDAVRASLESEDLLKWFLPRRRKFLPTLTRESVTSNTPIGDSRGIEIEYRDYDGSWKSAKPWGFDILETECGVFLKAEDIPEELYDQAEYGAIRVTATIEADICVTYVAEKLGDSPSATIKEAYIDLSDGYQARVVLTGSKYAGGDNNNAVDDSLAIESFAKSLRSRFDLIDIPGAVALEGVEYVDHLPGDRVAGIQGKNINFEVKTGSGQYPQIVAATIDIDAQKTILALQRFREFRPE